jgi:AcrR family transcriptional regulator
VHGMAKRVRPGADARQADIVAAACRVIARKGIDATRIADIAREARTSTGTVHYHFETKEDVLVAALEWANERPYGPLENSLENAPSASARLGALLDAAVPYPGERHDDFLLWVETAIAATRLPTGRLGPRSESVGRRWKSYFADVLGEGVENGAFHPVAPVEEVVERLIALADGLAFKCTVGQPWMPPERARELLRRFASEQLGVSYDELAERGVRA